MDRSKVYNSFSTKLMNNICQSDGNIVFSPLSVFAVLCMTAAGASGETRQEISDSMKEGYLKKIREDFDAECFMTHDLVNDVNRWVKDKTDNMIPEILNESAADTLCSLINAVTFKNTWWDPYNCFQVRKGDFHNMSGSVSKVYMLYGTADAYFSGMSTYDLFVDQVIHKAYIKVDRNGTTAAAATVMDMCGAERSVTMSSIYVRTQENCIDHKPLTKVRYRITILSDIVLLYGRLS